MIPKSGYRFSEKIMLKQNCTSLIRRGFSRVNATRNIRHARPPYALNRT
jgi:hypothetical protein